jgi:hypothetical protein
MLPLARAELCEARRSCVINQFQRFLFLLLLLLLLPPSLPLSLLLSLSLLPPRRSFVSFWLQNFDQICCASRSAPRAVPSSGGGGGVWLRRARQEVEARPKGTKRPRVHNHQQTTRARAHAWSCRRRRRRRRSMQSKQLRHQTGPPVWCRARSPGGGSLWRR